MSKLQTWHALTLERRLLEVVAVWFAWVFAFRGGRISRTEVGQLWEGAKKTENNNGHFQTQDSPCGPLLLVRSINRSPIYSFGPLNMLQALLAALY